MDFQNLVSVSSTYRAMMNHDDVIRQAQKLFHQRRLGRSTKLGISMTLRLEGAEIMGVDLAKTAVLYGEKLGLRVLQTNGNSMQLELIPKTHIKFVACTKEDFDKGTVSGEESMHEGNCDEIIVT